MMIDVETDRRVALITGGAKRVGRAIAEHLAASGFDVAITYFRSESVAESLRRSGIHTIRADAFNPESASETIGKEMRSRFGRLDVLVNNASAYLPARLNETTSELMTKLNAIHVQTPMLLCQQFESQLRAARGHVVNMVDLLAEKPWPEYLAYCTSKAALANLTLGLARELSPEVTVNGIAPGVVEWPADYPEADREKYLKRVPLGRAGSSADVARLVHFLCTDGNYITGQIIRLDGGRSLT